MMMKIFELYTIDINANYMRIDYLIFFVELIEMNLKIKLKILSAENHWLYMQKLLEKTAYTIKKPSSPRDAQVIEL